MLLCGFLATNCTMTCGTLRTAPAACRNLSAIRRASSSETDHCNKEIKTADLARLARWWLLLFPIAARRGLAEYRGTRGHGAGCTGCRDAAARNSGRRHPIPPGQKFGAAVRLAPRQRAAAAFNPVCQPRLAQWTGSYSE